MKLDKIKKKIEYSILDAGIHYNEFVDRHSKKNYYFQPVPIDGFKLHDGLPIYNEYGEQYKVCYMSDLGTRLPNRYLYFDRYDWGLKTHFYRGSRMFHTVGKPNNKYGFTGEPREVEPWEYELMDSRPEIYKEFDLVFSDDQNVLNRFPNARFVPFSCGPWYMKGKEKYDDLAYQKKNREISIIASNKEITDFHKLRKNIAKKCREKKLADAYGSFLGIVLDDYDSVFRNYRYSIVVENSQSDYYFTEKLTSCFAAQTIPIYLGARKIGDYFNADGIIQVSPSDFDNLEKLLAQCTTMEYEARLNAVLDNYNRVYKYKNGWNYLYENYLQNI